MGDLDNCPVDLNILSERNEVPQRNQEPLEYVCWGHVGEEGVRFDVGDRVDREQELMLLVRVPEDSHERVRQHGDQDGDHEEMAYEQEQCQDSFSQGIVPTPPFPSRRGETHDHLQQCVSHGAGCIDILASKREGQRDKESAAADEN